MKKNAAIIILAVILSLSSCGNRKKELEDYVTVENFVIYDAVSLPLYDMNELEKEIETTTVESKEISYVINDTRIELLVNSKTVKTLNFTYVPDIEKIVVDDFNFDGYNDIFIPYESPGTIYGDYYCYIPVENSFEKSSELTKIGRILTVNEGGILSEYQYDDYTERLIEYQWTDGRLGAFRKTEKYTSHDDGQLHTNIYGYTAEGAEFLQSSE